MKKFNKIIVSACLIVTFMFHTMNVEAQDLIAGFGAAFDEYGIPAPELDPSSHSLEPTLWLYAS